MKTIILCAGMNGRAVIIGKVFTDPVPGQPVHLHDARMVLYWAAECGGLFGLASRGPRGATKITAPIPEIVEPVWQEWMALTDASAREVEKWPAC